MITSVFKTLIGKKDINFDLDGTGGQFNKRNSVNGDLVSDFLINASHIPITSTTRAKKYADQTTPTSKTDLNVDSVLEQILDNLENIGLPDTTNFFTINSTTGVLTIAAGKITATEIADDTITTVKLKDASVTTDKVANGAISTVGQISNEVVNSQHYADSSIENAHLKDDIVGINELNLDNAGGTLSAFVVSAVKHTCTGGAATETITGLSGLVSGDMFLGTWNTNAGLEDILSIDYASATTATLTVTGTVVASDVITVVALRPTVAIS